MPRMRFTDLAIKKLTPPPRPLQVDVFDELLPGLYLKLSYGGSKSFRVLYYRGNKPRTIRIGRYPIVTLEEARKKARDILKEVSEGRDPKARRPKTGDTIDVVVDLFIERYAKPKNRSWRETERILKKEFVSEWAGRPIGTITRQDVNEVLDGIVDRGTPIKRRRCCG
jgi:hypothetical protein